MEKVGFFKKFEKNKVWQLVVFFVLEAMVLGCYFIAGKWADEEGRKEVIRKQGISSSYRLLREIEDVEIKDDMIKFSGWAFYPDAKNKEVALVLRDAEGKEEEHVVLCDLYDRDEIENYYFGETKTRNIGFLANIKEKELDKNKCYEMLIGLIYQTKNDQKGLETAIKVTTNRFFYKGEIFDYNPKDFVQPEIQDEELRSVIEKGKVRAYDKEEGLWIYQYNQKLFYVIDSRINHVCEENNLSIPVMASTSRTKLLPGERQQYGSDHLGAYYASDLYEREDVIPYQVVEVQLPLEYPLTYIKTGLYNNEEKMWETSLYILLYDWRVYDRE